MNHLAESIRPSESMQTFDQPLMGNKLQVTDHIKNFDRQLKEVFTLLAGSVFDEKQAEVVHRVFTRILNIFLAAVQAIDAKYRQVGEGLGSPQAPVKMGAGGGYYRRYQNGAIYWHPELGAFRVSGPIYQKYLQLGAEAGFLGYPTTDETKTADGIGRFNHFQHGSIYWSPETEAHEVHGGIREAWTSLGWDAGLLGYPTTDETATPDGVGRFNHFQHGSIYWTPDTGAHEVHGKIRETWSGMGWERSFLGYPISDEIGEKSLFQRGNIFLQDGLIRIAADARRVNTGTIHLEGGTAANGWAELTIVSNGSWEYKGSIRATGTLSYDVAIASAFDFKDSNGRGIAFAEEGDVEGTLVLGGNREHTWKKTGFDPFIRDNWDTLQSAGLKTVLKVDFGAGDVLA
ncbi:MAG: hypothetical protein ND866_30690 [Pyrinomonadaceae bacterium]|nr:hypothetical protein [Pyrinomonadaceae bacterium]